MIAKLIAVVLSLLVNGAIFAGLNHWGTATVVGVPPAYANAIPVLPTVTARDPPLSLRIGPAAIPAVLTITTLPTITVHPTAAQIESLRREQGQPR